MIAVGRWGWFYLSARSAAMLSWSNAKIEGTSVTELSGYVLEVLQEGSDFVLYRGAGEGLARILVVSRSTDASDSR